MVMRDDYLLNDTTYTPTIRYLQSIGKQLPKSCEPLYFAMQDFYEACRICSKYSDIAKVIDAIGVAFNKAVEEVKEPTREELRFFAFAEKEFAALLTTADSATKVIDVIRWCLAHDLLQQAATITSECLPIYMAENKIFEITDATIREDCLKHRLPWDTWNGFFFKSYDPFGQTTEIDMTELTIKKLRSFIKACNYDYIAVQKKLKGRNLQLDKFISSMLQLQLTAKGKFAEAVLKLNKSHPLNLVCRGKYSSLQEYQILPAMKKAINEKGPTVYILSILTEVSNKLLVEIFNLPIDETNESDKEDVEIANKIAARKYVFQRLIKEKGIKVIDERKFLDVVEKHIFIVNCYRNKMNHSCIDFHSLEGNDKIAATIKELLDLVERLAKRSTEDI